jgi:hypothetical protein
MHDQPRADDVMVLRQRVVEVRAAYRRGEVSYEVLSEAAGRYLDAAEARAKVLWPGRRFRRPTTAYVLRAL